MIKQFYFEQFNLAKTTRLHSGIPGSDDNEGVLHILHSSSTGTSQLDCFVSHSGHLGGGYSSRGMQSVYSTTQADWAGQESDV